MRATHEPFALVMVDMIEQGVADRLDALGAARSCGFGRERVGDKLDAPLEAIAIDERCGEVLGSLLSERGLDLSTGLERARAELVQLQIDATERHEIQHQVDGDEIDIPNELFRVASWADDESLTLVAQEASAHLAELTTEDSLGAAWRLADLTSFLLERTSRSPYRYATALLFSRLLGKPVMDQDGNVAVGAVRALWDEVAAHRSELGRWLAPRARLAHEQLFGTAVSKPAEVAAFE